MLDVINAKIDVAHGRVCGLILYGNAKYMQVSAEYVTGICILAVSSAAQAWANAEYVVSFDVLDVTNAKWLWTIVNI